MNKKISVNLALAIAIIAMTVTFSVTMILSQNLFDKTVASVREKEIMYQKIAEIDKTVRADYYSAINNETLYDMMGAGYMQGIGDANAKYYTAAQYNALLEEDSGTATSIGVEIVKESSGYARIVRVYTGSPAEEAGIELNSYILKVGDTDVKALTQTQIERLLAGEAGTMVSVTLVDALAKEQPAMQLQRRQYQVPSVETALLEDGAVGYLKFRTFNKNTETELRDALETMQAGETPVQSLVLDVRNNAGGTLAYALDVIDVLCPAGAVASVLEKDGSVTLYATSDLNHVDLPLVVLVNGNTASGAELLASAIQDFEMGKVVGTTTAGKGSMQCTPVRLTDGSAVSFTTNVLLTQNEVNFDGIGIEPDVTVALKAEDEQNFASLTVDTDPQIAKAVETVEALLPTSNKVDMVTSSSSTSDTSASSDTSEDASESKSDSEKE